MIGKVKISHDGGYDPDKARTHPGNQDPTLEKCAYAAFDGEGVWTAVAADDGDLKRVERAVREWLTQGLRVHRVSLDWVKAHELFSACEPPPHSPLLSLTPRQADLVRFIGSYRLKHGHGPTLREMAEHLGVNSQATIHAMLDRLETAGAIRRERRKSRSIQLVQGYKHL